MWHPLFSLTRTGGSVTLPAQAAVQRKKVCPPPCLAPPVSEPPLSPLQRWTPRPSSKLCSSPRHSPPPPLSPPAHRPLPFASRYSSCLVWIHCLFINILLHSQCSHTNCVFHLTAGNILSYKTDFYTFDIHDFWTWNSWIRNILFLVLWYPNVTCLFLRWTSGEKCDLLF